MMAKRTLQSILEMDISEFSRMNKKDLSKVVSQMASAANKRVKDLERKGNQSSPAYKGAEKTRTEEQEARGTLFGMGRGKHTLAETRKEFARLRNFLTAGSSTSSRYEYQLKQTVKKLQEKWSMTIDLEKAKDVFEAYDDLKKRFPQLGERAFKYDVAKMIAEGGKMPESADDAIDILDNLRRQYEQRERDYKGGLSDLLPD